MSRDLDLLVSHWLRRKRHQWSVRWAVIGAAAGLLAGLLLAGYNALALDLLSSEYLAWAAGLALGGLALGALVPLLVPINRLRAAQRFDSEFALKERISTALYLADSAEDLPLADRQLEDALQHARGVDPAAALPLRAPFRPLLAVLALLLVHLFVWGWGQSMFDAAQARRQIRDTIQAEGEQIEAIIEEIESSPDLTDEQKSDLVAPLEEAITDLSQAETLEEAYSALDEAHEQLEALQDPGAETAAAGLQQAGENAASQSTEGDPLEPFKEHLAQGDLEQAAEDLREVDAEAMEQAERERLARELEDLADALEEVDPDLAQELREAAEAARQGDSQAAQEALENAAQSIEELGESVQVAEAAGEAAEGVEESQETIVAAGQEPGEEGDPTGTPVAGTGGGEEDGEDGEGAGQGQGAGDGDGQGAGAGSGTGEGDGGSGDEAGQDPIGQGNNPDGAGESDFQPITPTDIDAEGSDWIAVPPSGESGENVTGVGPTDPGDSGPITVPYAEVLPDYQAAVNEAIDSGFVPPQFRDIVRDYFSSLEP